MFTESFGLIGSLLVIFSMMIKSNTPKRNIQMRVINAIACLFLVIYGCLVPAYSTAILNSFCFLVHIYHIIRGSKNGKI